MPRLLGEANKRLNYLNSSYKLVFNQNTCVILGLGLKNKEILEVVLAIV
jgi:hypothetical protein